jgi:hypothetical protein
MKICKDCDQKHVARGYCRKHHAMHMRAGLFGGEKFQKMYN